MLTSAGTQQHWRRAELTVLKLQNNVSWCCAGNYHLLWRHIPPPLSFPDSWEKQGLVSKGWNIYQNHNIHDLSWPGLRSGHLSLLCCLGLIIEFMSELKTNIARTGPGDWWGWWWSGWGWGRDSRPRLQTADQSGNVVVLLVQLYVVYV